MEVDCVRPMGANACVSIWVEGKIRAVTVTPMAVRRWLPPSQSMTDDECCEYVRTHLVLVQEAVRERLTRGDRTLDSVFLDGS